MTFRVKNPVGILIFSGLATIFFGAVLTDCSQKKSDNYATYHPYANYTFVPQPPEKKSIKKDTSISIRLTTPEPRTPEPVTPEPSTPAPIDAPQSSEDGGGLDGQDTTLNTTDGSDSYAFATKEKEQKMVELMMNNDKQGYEDFVRDEAIMIPSGSRIHMIENALGSGWAHIRVLSSDTECYLMLSGAKIKFGG